MAYSGLADTYALLGSYDIMPISESHPLGREAALKALDLNESLGEAHNSLAAILADHYWDWPGAERHFTRALELAPNYVTALHFIPSTWPTPEMPAKLSRLPSAPSRSTRCRCTPKSTSASF
jgi:hypothetical protein